MAFIFSSFFVFGQASKNINNYKYVIVPNQFDFLKEKDKYQTSSLTKFLFDKKFNAFLEDEIPQELAENKCNSLLVSFEDDSGMLTTKLKLTIKNCLGDILFSSEGSSKEKQYKRAYQQAIRDAYNTFDNQIKYNYEPNNASTIVKKEEINVTPNIPVVITKPNVKEVSINKETNTETQITSETLYAQQKENGFQLVNTIPEVVYFILKTKVEDVYIIKDKNGILYNKNGIWIAEFLENDKMITKTYQIKF